MKKSIRILILLMLLGSALTACKKQKFVDPEVTVPDTQPVSETASVVPETEEKVYPAELFDGEFADETTAETAALPQETDANTQESVPAPTQQPHTAVPSTSTDVSAGNGNFGSEIFD